MLDFFDGVEDSIRHDVFTGGAFNGTDARDGFTVSLWRDERMMIKAAYSNGQHRTVIDASRDGTYFDRSSFTRAIMISSNGSWNGDPSLEMQ